MGLALAQASIGWPSGLRTSPAVDSDFIVLSRKAAQRRKLRVQALIYLLFVGIIAGLIGWINQSYLKEQMNWFMTMRPYMVANFDPTCSSPRPSVR